MKTCKIPDCNNPHLAKGYCNKHYLRVKHFGNPYFNTRRDSGTGTFHHGYKLIHVKGKQVSEHRYLMEQKLGRKLKLHKEVVHHINGNRSDNRLENLEVKKWGEHSTYHLKRKCIRKENSKIYKYCPKCKKVLHRSKFRQTKDRDGVSAWCLICIRHHQHKFVKTCPICINLQNEKLHTN